MNRGRSAGSGGASHAHQHQQNQQHGGYGNHHNQTHQNNPTTGGVGPAPTPHHHHQQQQPQMMNNAYDYSYQLDDEFGGKDIDWSSIAVGGVSEAAATTTTTTATTATSITHQTNLNAKTQVPQAQAQQQQTTTSAAQPRVPPYNPYGNSATASGGGPARQQYGHQQNQYSASSSVGLTDGAVVMSSGGSGGGGGGSSSASGTPGSAHGAGAGHAEAGHAGGSASNAIDLTTDDNHTGGQQQQGQAGGSAGSSANAQEEELRKKIEQLTAQLESKDDVIFSLQLSLTSVEAEASHRTQKAESEAASRVRLVEDKLRLVQREADSARASLARERTRRGGGGGGGKSSTEMMMDRHQHHQQQQQVGGGHGLQHRSDGMKQHGGGKRVVTPPEQNAASAAAGASNPALPESMMMASARFQPILSSIGGSGEAGSGAGLMQSRNQRVASHLLLNLDLIWPEEDNGPGVAVSAFMVTSGGEGAKPPQSKRQRRHGSAGTGSDGGANTKGGGLIRSGAIHPGSREAERYKAAGALRGQKEPNQSTSDKRQDATNATAANGNQGLPAGNAASVGSHDGRERAAVRTLLTQIASWDANKAESPPPSVGALVRDLIVMITSNFDYSGAGAKGGSEAEPMVVDGPGNDSSKSKDGASNDQNRPKILSDKSWTTVVRLTNLLREVLILSSEARDVVRIWLARSAYPDISISLATVRGSSVESTSKTRSRISFLGSGDTSEPSDAALDRVAVDVREAMYGIAAIRPTIEGNSDCWDAKSIESTCGKFRDIICGAILGIYSLGKPFDVLRQSGIGSFEKESSSLFLALMADAPSPAGCHDLGIWAVWFDELLPTAFLETSSSDPTAITPGTDLVAILEDGSDLVSGFPRRRTIKKKARYFKSRHRNRRANNYVMEMKSFALQIVLRLVDCCDDSRNRWLQGDPLCRRVLAAVLDELEGSILPVLDSVPTNSNRKLTEHPLSFCQVATAYTSLLCRSTDGFKLLRTQMISDFSRTAGGHRERLSFSGIAIMIDILRWTLNAPKPTNGELGRDLVALSQSIRDSIVDFFCLIWSQVAQIRLSEGEAESDTLLSVVDERREIFIGCFSEMQCPLTRTAVRENTLLAVEQIMREIGYDIDEE